MAQHLIEAKFVRVRVWVRARSRARVKVRVQGSSPLHSV